VSDDLRIDPKYRDGLAIMWTQDRGERLKHARMKMMFDQRELAEKLGVPQQTISKIETGQPTGAEISVRKMVSALGERLFLYVLNGTGAVAIGDPHRLEREFKDYRFRINRANRVQRLKPKEEAALKAHTKRVIGELDESDGSDKESYVYQPKLTK
jgi:DNA-binding XRE family transcriptional regulator